ncbi:unnamed protein product, partial [Strongylus vulgaris]
MDESSSVEGRIKSPTLSQSSKRTQTSAELKASMRSKLRKQAEQTVERKRGSVHLAKRLQRRLTIHQEEGPTEGELQSVDEQIEKSLKTFVDEIRGSDYVQLDIFLGTVSFEQHPLCGEEDKIAVRLSALYDEQLKRMNEMTDTLVNIEN